MEMESKVPTPPAEKKKAGQNGTSPRSKKNRKGSASGGVKELTKAQAAKMRRVSRAYGLPSSSPVKAKRRSTKGSRSGNLTGMITSKMSDLTKRLGPMKSPSERGGAFHMSTKAPERAQKPVGRFWVRIKAGRNLVPMDRGGTSDPYCELRLLHPPEDGVGSGAAASAEDDHFVHQTEICPTTLNPEWYAKNEVIWMPKTKRMVLNVVVWDYDQVGYDDFMGEIMLPLEGLTGPQVYDSWRKLQPRFKHHDHVSGEIHIQCAFIPTGSKIHNVSIPCNSYASSIESIDSIISNPVMWGAFIGCVKKNLCEELSDFYSEIMLVRYEQERGRLVIGTDAWNAKCHEIYHRYIKNGADKEINISASEKTKIKKKMYADDDKMCKEVKEGVEDSVFDDAHKETKKLLNTNFFKKFIEGHWVSDGLEVGQWTASFQNFAEKPDIQTGAVQWLINSLTPEQRKKLVLG